MKKFYLVNYDTTEIAHFNDDNEAFEEAQKRNNRDRYANWKAYDEYGNAIYGVYVRR